MTEDDKAAFIAKIKRDEAAANARGKTIVWYEVRPDGSGVEYRYAVRAKRRPAAKIAEPETGRRRSASRGALIRPGGRQGSLL